VESPDAPARWNQVFVISLRQLTSGDDLTSSHRNTAFAPAGIGEAHQPRQEQFGSFISNSIPIANRVRGGPTGDRISRPGGIVVRDESVTKLTAATAMMAQDRSARHPAHDLSSHSIRPRAGSIGADL
jgi:hypothetical protein